MYVRFFSIKTVPIHRNGNISLYNVAVKSEAEKYLSGVDACNTATVCYEPIETHTKFMIKLDKTKIKRHRNVKYATIIVQYENFDSGRVVTFTILKTCSRNDRVQQPCIIAIIKRYCVFTVHHHHHRKIFSISFNIIYIYTVPWATRVVFVSTPSALETR